MSLKISQFCYLLSAMTFLIGLVSALFIVPSDYQQGDAFRIIYLHVPAAFLSLFIYSWMSFLAVLVLVWRIKIAGVVLKHAASLGGSMTFIALLTGIIWGKPMWGTWWIWDARLTSELILLFLYFGVIALFNAIPQFDRAVKVASVMTLVGLVDLPIIHYSVDWWNTLHQGSSLSLFAKPKIAGDMLYPLIILLVAFTSYIFAVVLSRTRDDLLWHEKRSQWVRAIQSEAK